VAGAFHRWGKVDYATRTFTMIVHVILFSGQIMLMRGVFGLVVLLA
jgi:hypothetical protein